METLENDLIYEANNIKEDTTRLFESIQTLFLSIAYYNQVEVDAQGFSNF
jgi:hypothetical protein